MLTRRAKCSSAASLLPSQLPTSEPVVTRHCQGSVFVVSICGPRLSVF